jgi:hypothetical protein
VASPEITGFLAFYSFGMATLAHYAFSPGLVSEAEDVEPSSGESTIARLFPLTR